jgi:predicted DNA-binding protein (MmcQ/YjbR family)
MNWDELKAVCLDQPGATETFPFGQGCSVFKAPNAKMFAVSVTTSQPLDISVKCDPERSVALRQEYEAITEGYHLNKRHWITVTLNRDVPDPMVRELIQDSYDLVASTGARTRVVAAGAAAPHGAGSHRSKR